MAGIGASIVFFAVGAILDFGVYVSPYQHGFNIHSIGVILMIVGAVGFVLSLLLGGSGRGWDGGPRRAGELRAPGGHLPVVDTGWPARAARRPARAAPGPAGGAADERQLIRPSPRTSAPICPISLSCWATSGSGRRPSAASSSSSVGPRSAWCAARASSASASRVASVRRSSLSSGVVSLMVPPSVVPGPCPPDAALTLRPTPESAIAPRFAPIQSGRMP